MGQRNIVYTSPMLETKHGNCNGNWQNNNEELLVTLLNRLGLQNHVVNTSVNTSNTHKLPQNPAAFYTLVNPGPVGYSSPLHHVAQQPHHLTPIGPPPGFAYYPVQHSHDMPHFSPLQAQSPGPITFATPTAHPSYTTITSTKQYHQG